MEARNLLGGFPDPVFLGLCECYPQEGVWGQLGVGVAAGSHIAMQSCSVSWHLWEVGPGRNATHCLPGKMLVGGPSRR